MKRSCQITCIALTLFLLGQFFNAVSANASPTSGYEPKLVIIDTELPVLHAGTRANVSFSIRNDGSPARRIRITPLLNNDQPFSAVNLVVSQHIDELLPKYEADVSFTFQVEENAKSGVYPVVLEFEYSNFYGDVYNREYTIYVEVRGGAAPPKLVISRVYTEPEQAIAGGTIDMILSVQNIGSLPAHEVVVSAAGLSEDGFSLVSGTNRFQLGEILGGQTEQVRLQLAASEDIKPGTNSMEISIDYQDADGTAYDSLETVFIPVSDVSGSPKVLISQVTTQPEPPLVPGSIVHLKLMLTNVGDADASEIVLTLDGLAEEGLYLVEGTSVKHLATLAMGHSSILEYNLITPKEFEKESVKLTASLSYKGLKEEANTQSQDIYLSFLTQDEEVEGMPKLVFGNVHTVPEVVAAGTEFELQLGLTNSHHSKVIKNARVTFEDSSRAIIPVGSGYAFYFADLDPGDTAYQTLPLRVVHDAEPGIYQIVFEARYEDNEGNEYSITESVGVQVNQEARLGISNVRLDEAVAGKPTTLYVEFYNTGRSKIYSLMVTAAGEDLMIDAPTYFVGNFEAGSSDYFQTDVIATTPGKYEGEVVFTYEDAAGEKYELRRPFTVYADEATSFTPTLGGSGSVNTDKPQDTEETEQDGLSVQLYILLGSLVLLAGVGIIFLLQRRRNKDVLIND